MLSLLLAAEIAKLGAAVGAGLAAIGGVNCRKKMQAFLL